MTAVLAVDLGKSGCRGAVWTGRARGPVCEAPGAPGLAGSGGVDAAAAAVLAVCTRVLREAAVTRLRVICVGAAGAAAAPTAARALAERLLAELPTEEVAVTSDAITSHAGALGAAAGVVLAAGTGAVAVGVGEEGGFALVDGWGPWLGDDGSGAWIGLAGLRAALRAHDGRGPATALQQAAVEEFGDLGRLPAALGRNENPAATAAAFAPAVARAAVAKDRAAADVMRRAAGALGESVVTAARRIGGTGPIPVAVTGGLTNLGAPLLEPLTAAILAGSDPPLRIQPALGGPLDGARLLAFPLGGPHEPFIIRSRRAGTTGSS